MTAETWADQRPRKEHWERIYREKGSEELSWFQREPRLALDLIGRVAPDPQTRIVDAGGGSSRLVDGLLDAGYRRVTVIDISSEAIKVAKDRLGKRASLVNWRVDDVLAADLAPGSCDVWHDRAVFHFLTKPSERARYISKVGASVRPGGFVIIATFAEDGPLRCSGLEVQRYSAAALAAEFGDSFEVLERHREEHRTSAGATQAFTWAVFRYQPPGR